MKKFYEKVIAHPIVVIVIFGLLTAFAAVCKPLISVNYDMNDYLPADSKSTVSLEVMEQEFSGGIPNAQVMVKNVTVPQALDYKERISAVDGVDEVTWLDDSIDVTQPLEIADKDAVETYYKDSNALFSVTIGEENYLDAVAEIRSIIGDDNAMNGTIVSNAVATESTVSEIARIAVFAVIFVIVVLVFTTSSWLEPVIIMIGMGVAILILFFNLPIDNVYRKIRHFCEAAWRRSRRKSRTMLIPSKPPALTYRFLSGNQYIDIVYILIRN